MISLLAAMLSVANEIEIIRWRYYEKVLAFHNSSCAIAKVNNDH